MGAGGEEGYGGGGGGVKGGRSRPPENRLRTKKLCLLIFSKEHT